LIREIKYVAEKPDKQTANWGINLLNAVQEIFHLIHRKDELLLQNWLRKMFAMKENILQLSNYYGHDFLKVWAKCIHCLNNKNFNDKKLHEDICLVFNSDMFKKTQLYKQLKDWEKCFALSLFPNE
jgi:hypothetical protein